MRHWDGTSAEAADWYEPLPDADTTSYGAVIASNDEQGAAVTSAGVPVEPSTESLPVTAAPPSLVAGTNCATEGPPVGSSTPPEMDAPVVADSLRALEEEPSAASAPVGPPPAGPAVEPAAASPPEVTPASALDSAVFHVSDMTGTRTQTPSVVADGAPKVAPHGETPATVADAQAALRALQVECGYAGVSASLTIPAGLASPRTWLVEVTQLKARMASLQFVIRQTDTGEELLRGETMERLHAAQDHLAVLSEQVAVKRPYGLVDTDSADTTQGTEPSTKRQRRDSGRPGRRGEL